MTTLCCQHNVTVCSTMYNTEAGHQRPYFCSALSLSWLHSWDQTNLEMRWSHRNGGDLFNLDWVLALWWSDIETLDETCEDKKYALASYDLSGARTLS